MSLYQYLQVNKGGRGDTRGQRMRSLLEKKGMGGPLLLLLSLTSQVYHSDDTLYPTKLTQCKDGDISAVGGGRARRRRVQDVAGEARNMGGSDTCRAHMAIFVKQYQTVYMFFFWKYLFKYN